MTYKRILYSKEQSIPNTSKVWLLAGAFTLTILYYYKVGAFTIENYMYAIIGILFVGHIAIKNRPIFIPRFFSIYVFLGLTYLFYSMIRSGSAHILDVLSELHYLPGYLFVILIIQFRYPLVRYCAFSVLFFICVSAIIAVGQILEISLFCDIRSLLTNSRCNTDSMFYR